MPGTITPEDLTEKQKVAYKFLKEKHTGVSLTWSNGGKENVRMTAGELLAKDTLTVLRRWIVRPDGKIAGAFDPEPKYLDNYLKILKGEVNA